MPPSQRVTQASEASANSVAGSKRDMMGRAQTLKRL